MAIKKPDVSRQGTRVREMLRGMSAVTGEKQGTLETGESPNNPKPGCA